MLKMTNSWWILFPNVYLWLLRWGWNFFSSLRKCICIQRLKFYKIWTKLQPCEIFKVIWSPNFHWIWTKPHDALGDVFDRNTTLMCTWNVMKICKDLAYLMFQISAVGIGSWSFWGYSKILCKIGCEIECYTLQGLSKKHIWCKHKKFKPQRFPI